MELTELPDTVEEVPWEAKFNSAKLELDAIVETPGTVQTSSPNVKLIFYSSSEGEEELVESNLQQPPPPQPIESDAGNLFATNTCTLVLIQFVFR